MFLSGIIVEQHKSIWRVDTANGVFNATRKGTVKKNLEQPCVGDQVEIETINPDGIDALITLVHPRTTVLKRPVIANINQILFVTALTRPPVDLDVLDRFLFNAELLDISVSLVFNKFDLLSPDDRERQSELVESYRTIGYSVLEVSALDPACRPRIISVCVNKISAFAGVSGVGKSKLLNLLFPERALETGELSKKLDRGTHTTSASRLLKLPEGGFVADTPGFACIDVSFVSEQDVCVNFIEMKALIGKCRFNNCLHENEPGCVVKEKVEKGEIAKTRYQAYLKILADMRNHRDRYK